MWRRTRLIAVPDDVSMMQLIGRLDDFDIVVVDVDNTLAPDDAPGPVMAARLDEVRRAFRMSGNGRLVVASNGPRSRAVAGDGIVWEMDKPLTRRSRLGISRRDSVAVVGDKVLTDGVLAHRWRAAFYLKPFTPRSEGQRPGLRRVLERVVRRLLFAEGPLD